MTILLDSRRSAKPCPFKTFRSILTPAVSTLARPSLSLFPCYILPATGGRVPLVYPERARRVNQPRLLTVHCRLLTFRESLATSSISFISPPYEHQPRISLVSPTYAKTGGWVPPQKCRRADIFDFSPYFSHFSCPEPAAKRRTPPARLRRRPEAAPTKKAGHSSRVTRLSSPVTGHQSPVTSSPLSVTSRQYCAPIARDGAKTEPRGIPAWSGSPRCGYVPFEHRCPDAHD